MRKWLLIGMGIIMLAILTFLGKTAVDPSDFIGEWYSADSQEIYRFQDGIIHSNNDSDRWQDGDNISGAYIFSGKSVALFAIGVEGLESVKELYLIENKEESLLCEQKDGTGKIYFVRHK